MPDFVLIKLQLFLSAGVILIEGLAWETMIATAPTNTYPITPNCP